MQQIVEAEQGGEKRALYGKALLRGLTWFLKDKGRYSGLLFFANLSAC